MICTGSSPVQKMAETLLSYIPFVLVFASALIESTGRDGIEKKRLNSEPTERTTDGRTSNDCFH